MKLLILIFVPLLSWANELQSFKTDYCTNYPEGTITRPELWKHCCLKHDLFYWAGGTRRDMDHADLDLKSCVEATGEKIQAEIIYRGVRLGHLSPYKYPEGRWGNGWSQREDYVKLDQREIGEIESEMMRGYDFITPALKEAFIEALKQR